MVDDDDSMRAALYRLLGVAGFDPKVYASAEALLAEDADTQAVCVVADLKLPGLSGLDLLAAMRARREQVPLILITAHDVPGQREESVRRGAASYLVKPFSGTELLETVNAVIASGAWKM